MGREDRGADRAAITITRNWSKPQKKKQSFFPLHTGERQELNKVKFPHRGQHPSNGNVMTLAR